MDVLSNIGSRVGYESVGFHLFWFGASSSTPNRIWNRIIIDTQSKTTQDIDFREILKGLRRCGIIRFLATATEVERVAGVNDIFQPPLWLLLRPIFQLFGSWMWGSLEISRFLRLGLRDDRILLVLGLIPLFFEVKIQGWPNFRVESSVIEPQ